MDKLMQVRARVVRSLLTSVEKLHGERERIESLHNGWFYEQQRPDDDLTNVWNYIQVQSYNSGLLARVSMAEEHGGLLKVEFEGKKLKDFIESSLTLLRDTKMWKDLVFQVAGVLKVWEENSFPFGLTLNVKSKVADHISFQVLGVPLFETDCNDTTLRAMLVDLVLTLTGKTIETYVDLLTTRQALYASLVSALNSSDPPSITQALQFLEYENWTDQQWLVFNFSMSNLLATKPESPDLEALEQKVESLVELMFPAPHHSWTKLVPPQFLEAMHHAFVPVVEVPGIELPPATPLVNSSAGSTSHEMDSPLMVVTTPTSISNTTSMSTPSSSASVQASPFTLLSPNSRTRANRMGYQQKRALKRSLGAKHTHLVPCGQGEVLLQTIHNGRSVKSAYRCGRNVFSHLEEKEDDDALTELLGDDPKTQTSFWENVSPLYYIGVLLEGQKDALFRMKRKNLTLSTYVFPSISELLGLQFKKLSPDLLSSPVVSRKHQGDLDDSPSVSAAKRLCFSASSPLVNSQL